MGSRRILAVFAGLGLGLAFFYVGLSFAERLPPRLSFQVATGSTTGAYFPVGETIAGIVSHPPGLARCDVRGVCGPEGLIVSARTSDGGAANVLAVNAGLVDSGLVQGNVVADALGGQGAFRKSGPQTHIRTIASLFSEPVQLVVAAKSRIAKVSELKGKRVSLGPEGSGTEVVARAILSAYDLPLRRLKIRHGISERDADLLQKGKIDAFFFEGGAPSPLIGDLLARGAARLVAIDGRGARILLRRVPGLSADTIPAGAYPGLGAIPTVGSQTIWVVRDTASPDIVYGITRALFHPANKRLIDAAEAPARYIRLDQALNAVQAPLHPGAEKFYREKGMLANKR